MSSGSFIVSVGPREEAVTAHIASTSELDNFWKKAVAPPACVSASLVEAPAAAQGVAEDGHPHSTPTVVAVQVPVSARAQAAAWSGLLADWKDLTCQMILSTKKSGVFEEGGQDEHPDGDKKGSSAAAAVPILCPPGSGLRLKKVAAELKSVSPGRAVGDHFDDSSSSGTNVDRVANEVFLSAEFCLVPGTSSEVRAGAGAQLRDLLLGIVTRHYPGMHGSPQVRIHTAGVDVTMSKQQQQQPCGSPLNKPPPSPSGKKSPAFFATAPKRASSSQQQQHERQTSLLSDIGSDGGSICEHHVHGRTHSQQGVEDMIAAGGGSSSGMMAGGQQPSDAEVILQQQQQMYYQQYQQQHQQQAYYAGPGAAVPPPPPPHGGHVRIGSRNSNNSSQNHHSRNHSRTYSNNSQNQQQQQAAAYYAQQQQVYYGAQQQPQQHQRMSSSPPPTYNDALTLITSGNCAAGPVQALPTVTIGKTAKQMQQETALATRVAIGPGGSVSDSHMRTTSASSLQEHAPGGDSRSREGSTANDAVYGVSSEISQIPLDQQMQQPTATAAAGAGQTPPGHQKRMSAGSSSSPPGGSGGNPPGHRKRLSALALALTSSPSENAAATAKTPPMGPAAVNRGDATTPHPPDMNSSIGALPPGVSGGGN